MQGPASATWFMWISEAYVLILMDLYDDFSFDANILQLQDII